MRRAIKLSIALFFIIGSFLLGKYLNYEEVNKLNEKVNLCYSEIDSIKRENIKLEDSISMLKNYTDSLYFVLHTVQDDKNHH